MVPSSRLHHPVNAHFGNGWVGCSARETGNLAKKLFQTVSGHVLEFTTKSFPRHKTALLERTSVPEMAPSAHSIFFSLALILLLSSLFLLTISRPPGGMSKQKKSFTLLYGRPSHIPYYSTGMGRVGFFSSLFANRTSNTPFLYVAFAVRGSTMCGISSSFSYRLFADSTLIFNALSVDSSLISSFSTPGSSVTTTTSFPVSMTSTSGSLSSLTWG